VLDSPPTKVVIAILWSETLIGGTYPAHRDGAIHACRSVDDRQRLPIVLAAETAGDADDEVGLVEAARQDRQRGAGRGSRGCGRLPRDRSAYLSP
jgi:hypothetical protein